MNKKHKITAHSERPVNLIIGAKKFISEPIFSDNKKSVALKQPKKQ